MHIFRETFEKMLERHEKELVGLVKARQNAFDAIQSRRDAEKTARSGEPQEVTNKYTIEFKEKADFYREQESKLTARHAKEAETRIEQENENKEANKKVQSLLSDLKTQERQQEKQPEQKEEDKKPANQNELSDRDRRKLEFINNLKADMERGQEREQGNSR